MRDDVVRALACPVCHLPLVANGDVLACRTGHAFDLSRQGYANLLAAGPKRPPGDTAQMVAARERFLSSGAYGPIADQVASVAREYVPDDTPGLIADIGAGTGWLLAQLLDALPERSGLALDVSKYAARRAAKAHARAGAVVADAWSRLPLQNGSAVLLVSFFAPRQPAEFRRVLTRDGAAIVVTPAQDHLAELIGPLRLVSVDPQKDERLERAFSGIFTPVAGRRVEYGLALSHANVADLASMGPSAYHLSPAALSETLSVMHERVNVTVAVDVRVYRPDE